MELFQGLGGEICFKCLYLPLQPARLNVFKNDQDTWDYTNPNLSGQGNAHLPPPPSPFPLHPLLDLFVFFLFSYHATLWDG